MQMDHQYLSVNGRQIDAAFSAGNTEEIFVPLLYQLSSLQKEKGRRILVLLAAPPAVGKSTLSVYLEKLSREREGLVPLQAVGMDGFHRFNRELSGKTAIRDGKKVKLSEIKGAPETYDLPRLETAVQRLLTEAVCSWPLYDRSIHDPVEDAVRIREEIILLEGNYLLLDAPHWRDLRHYADYTVRILAEEETVRERLIQRKAASGITREAAEACVDFSDLYNVRNVMTHFLPADLTLRLLPDGTYKKEKAAP